MCRLRRGLYFLNSGGDYPVFDLFGKLLELARKLPKVAKSHRKAVAKSNFSNKIVLWSIDKAYNPVIIGYLISSWRSSAGRAADL